MPATARESKLRPHSVKRSLDSGKARSALRHKVLELLFTLSETVEALVDCASQAEFNAVLLAKTEGKSVCGRFDQLRMYATFQKAPLQSSRTGFRFASIMMTPRILGTVLKSGGPRQPRPRTASRVFALTRTPNARAQTPKPDHVGKAREVGSL